MDMIQVRVMSATLILSIVFQTAIAQVYKYEDLDRIFEVHPENDVLQIELMASKKFHEIINAYRISHNKDTLIWSNALWLASSNHNSYMYRNNHFSHSEIINRSDYTGGGLIERFMYLFPSDEPIINLGENMVKGYLPRDIQLLKNNEKLADYIAVNAFENWKISTGHNRNMLNGIYVSHGVAFRIDKGRYLASNLFCLGKIEIDGDSELTWRINYELK